MDPITQGALGAVAAVAVSPRHNVRLAGLVGWAGGMLADADVFIRSDADPLLHLEYHRHFTHALVFIPVGGLICAAALYFFVRSRLSFRRLYLYSTSGYATAGLLDACTSYGTRLLWPFSDARISWNVISVVDPLFTLILLALFVAGVVKQAPAWARGALVFCLAYLAIGLLQRERASAVQERLAFERGHLSIGEATVKPSIANLILWRSLYAHEGRYHVDAIRVAPFTPPKVYHGASLDAFDLEPALERIPADSTLAHDLRRFSHFSEGYLARLPDEPRFLTDLRYSALPNAVDPLWGIKLPDNPTQHVAFEVRRDIDEAERGAFLHMLLGKPEDRETSGSTSASDP